MASMKLLRIFALFLLLQSPFCSAVATEISPEYKEGQDNNTLQNADREDVAYERIKDNSTYTSQRPELKTEIKDSSIKLLPLTDQREGTVNAVITKCPQETFFGKLIGNFKNFFNGDSSVPCHKVITNNLGHVYDQNTGNGGVNIQFGKVNGKIKGLINGVSLESAYESGKDQSIVVKPQSSDKDETKSVLYYPSHSGTYPPLNMVFKQTAGHNGINIQFPYKKIRGNFTDFLKGNSSAPVPSVMESEPGVRPVAFDNGPDSIRPPLRKVFVQKGGKNAVNIQFPHGHIEGDFGGFLNGEEHPSRKQGNEGKGDAR